MPYQQTPEEFLKSSGYSDKELAKISGKSAAPEPAAPSRFIPQKAAPATTGGWQSDTPGAVGTAPVSGGWTSDEPGATPPAAEPSLYGRVVRGLEWATGHRPEDKPGEGDWQQRAGKGVARGLATDVQEAGRLAQHFNPEAAARFKQEHPNVTNVMRQLRQFSEQPSTSWAESIGEAFGESLPTSFLPLGVGSKAAKAAVRPLLARTGARAAQPAQTVAKYIRSPGPGSPGHWVQQVVSPAIPGSSGRLTQGARWAARQAGRLGTAGEIGGYGALGGALADPEHPGQGAEAGAAGAVAGTAGSKFFRSSWGQHLGDLLAREGTYKVLHDMFGIPYYPLAGPLIIWRSSPIGKVLRKVGDNIMDQTGRVIGAVNPMAAGMAASRLGGAPGTAIGGQMGDIVRQIVESVGRGGGTPTPED
jgi:hypothetical protein